MIDPDFLWAVGIEDTFIIQPHRRTGRLLDEYELTQHYDRWREDLGLVASLGVTHLRYGIPWHRVNPAPGVFDWSWTDQVLEHMAGDLGLAPIVDLMHYGCPLWLEGEFANPDYPARVAEYAAAFVQRYRGLTRWYTPLNEPLVNARFCGYTGVWPPYLRGWRGWMRVAIALVDGMSRSVAAIRQLQPEARIVHVEACSSLVTEDPRLDDVLHVGRLREYLPTDLLLGRVGPEHPLHGWALEHGASPVTLERLRSAAARIDVMGVNFYPAMSCWSYAERDGNPVLQHRAGGAAELAAVIRSWGERYGVPVMVTETSRWGTVPNRGRWLDASVEAVRRLRADEFPIIGYTWFPLFSLFRWSYRSGRGPLGAYLTDMGLWDLRDDGHGGLERIETPLADRFREHVATAITPLGVRQEEVTL